MLMCQKLFFFTSKNNPKSFKVQLECPFPYPEAFCICRLVISPLVLGVIHE